ncbi:MAG: radical SAM protein [Methylocystis silviterrae]|uniref:radical SAM protein n=1 Tax=Methylocystis silviterrae TaxID=2743612 RepID=UPI003C735674
METASHLEIVVKISKHCNLRCAYCYEFAELGDRARMSLAQIERLFETLRSYIDARGDLESVRFAWQGGEPLLVKPAVWREIDVLARRLFAGTPAPVSHIVQTNLTALSADWLDFLKERRFFDDIGVSFDVYGDQRVDVTGRLVNERVLTNLERLAEAQIPFAAIAVATRQTLPHLENIRAFFDELGIEARILPFNHSADAGQRADCALTPDEIVDAFCALFDGWMTSPSATPVQPLAEYLAYALDHLEGAPPSEGTADQESVFVVNTDGRVWGAAELYAPGRDYGNIFETAFSELLRGKNRLAARKAARERVMAYCRPCPYFGACPGYAVAFSFPDEIAALETHGCPVRKIIAHIVARLVAAAPSEASACS